MATTRANEKRHSERGEGMLRLVVFLALLGIAGYLGISNIPTYWNIRNAEHELADLARGTGVQKMPADRVRPQAIRIANAYEIPPTDVKVENMPNGGIQINLNTRRVINLIVTDYDWKISEVYTQSPY